MSIKNGKDVVCLTCGQKKYYGKSTLTHLCKEYTCSKCRMIKRRNEEVEKECEFCGKTYKCKSWEAKWCKHFYCSRECRIAKKQSRYKLVVCKNCGKVKSFPKYPLRQFCNKECALEYRIKTTKVITRDCDYCHKPYTKPRSLIGRFCSKECKDNHYWGKNRISIQENVRKWGKYKAWQRKVRKRFNIWSSDFHVHHIKPLNLLIREAMDKMPLLDWKQAVLSYEPVWDINNGVVIEGKEHMVGHLNKRS